MVKTHCMWPQIWAFYGFSHQRETPVLSPGVRGRPSDLSIVTRDVGSHENRQLRGAHGVHLGEQESSQEGESVLPQRRGWCPQVPRRLVSAGGVLVHSWGFTTGWNIYFKSLGRLNCNLRACMFFFRLLVKYKL